MSLKQNAHSPCISKSLKHFLIKVLSVIIYSSFKTISNMLKHNNKSTNNKSGYFIFSPSLVWKNLEALHFEELLNIEMWIWEWFPPGPLFTALMCIQGVYDVIIRNRDLGTMLPVFDAPLPFASNVYSLCCIKLFYINNLK